MGGFCVLCVSSSVFVDTDPFSTSLFPRALSSRGHSEAPPRCCHVDTVFRLDSSSKLRAQTIVTAFCERGEYHCHQCEHGLFTVAPNFLLFPNFSCSHPPVPPLPIVIGNRRMMPVNFNLCEGYHTSARLLADSPC